MTSQHIPDKLDLSDEEDYHPMRLNFALIIVEVVRLLMDVLDWYDKRKSSDPNNRPLPQTFEVYQIQCYQCDQFTGCYTSPTGALLPPIICQDCIDGLSEDEPTCEDQEPDEHEDPTD